MERVLRAWEDRACVAGTIADRDHVVEVLAKKLRDRLAAGRRPIDLEFAQDSDSVRIDLRGLGARRDDLEVGAAITLQERLGELASS